MNTLPSLRSSLWQVLRDPQYRMVLYLWLIVAGLCVMAANTLAAGG